MTATILNILRRKRGIEPSCWALIKSSILRLQSSKFLSSSMLFVQLTNLSESSRLIRGCPSPKAICIGSWGWRSARICSLSRPKSFRLCPSRISVHMCSTNENKSIVSRFRGRRFICMTCAPGRITFWFSIISVMRILPGSTRERDAASDGKFCEMSSSI